MSTPNYIARLISAAYRHQMAYLNRKLTPFHIGGGSYLFLLTIQENPGITQSELCRVLSIDKATTSKMLTALEREGMIRRTPNHEDRRAVILTVTQLGTETYRHLLEEAALYREAMLKDIPVEERQTTERVLQQVLRNIQAL